MEILGQQGDTVTSIVAGAAVAGIAGLATVGAAIINRLRTRNDEADYAERLIGLSETALNRLRAELDDERRRSERCERRYDALVTYLRAIGLDPPEVN